MARKRGTGLMMVMADVPAELEDEFNRWYNEEHIADLLAVPGVLNAARYVAINGGPKYLACYELESPSVVDTDALQRFVKQPSPWSQRVAGNRIATNYVRNVYQMIYPADLIPAEAEADMAPVLQIGRMDIPSSYEEEFNDWYNTVYVPNYCRVPGVIRVRRFVVSVGEPKYVTVYEFEHENVPESPEWEATRDANPWSLRIRPQMQHAPGSPGVYTKLFQL